MFAVVNRQGSVEALAPDTLDEFVRPHIAALALRANNAALVTGHRLAAGIGAVCVRDVVYRGTGGQQRDCLRRTAIALKAFGIQPGAGYLFIAVGAVRSREPARIIVG